ncbi:alpha/beta-hydrolase [Thozetella sp. PMI_491]|nr:alpha/beta-hydrolase [Thozetella sp. PMI_491]
MSTIDPYPLWSYQPLRFLYNVYDALYLTVKLPYWAVISALPNGRPSPQWTFKQAIMSRILRAGFHKKAVIGITETHSLLAGKEVDCFQVIAPFSDDFYLGPLASVARVKPGPVGGTWYPSNMEVIEAKSPSLGTVALHIHGGAFIWGDGRTECSGFLAEIMREEAGVDAVFSIQYRLSAHEGVNPFPAALQDALTAFLYLVRTLEMPPAKIVLVGDSCGATIATGLIRYLGEFGPAFSSEGLQLPCCVILASPMIAPLKTAGPGDLSQSAYATHANFNTDFVPLSTLRWGWQAYAGGAAAVAAAARDPYFTPLGHPFSTPVPLFVSLGEREIFVPENESWVAEMQAVSGNRVILNYEKDALHDTLLLGNVLGFEQSAKKVAAKAAKFIQDSQWKLNI